jgi:4-amino-4-deoxy-L-arabinose transferase-like glycosyltransferase
MKKRLTFAVLLIYYFALVALANRRHLSHDELYTYYIAQSPSLSELWQNLRFDLNPPLIYLSVRASMRLLGDTPWAVRLPSSVAFLGASLCLYAIISRRLRLAYGFLAVLIFWSTPALSFATEARPYAFTLGFFGLATLSWLRAIESPRPTWPAVTLAAAVTGMMLSHFLAVLFLAPFLLGEAFRLIRSRRPDWPVAAALLAPCILPLLFLRTINAYRSESTFPPAFEAGFRKMASYYYWTLYQEGWVILVAFCAALLVTYPSRAWYPSRAREQAVFLLALLSLPVIVNGVMMASHSAFFARYSAPTLFAYPVILATILASCTNKNRLRALIMAVILELYIPVQYLAKPLPKSPDFSAIHPELPLVAASGLSFLEMDHEQPRPTLDRLYYLTDHSYALQYAHATIFEGFTTLKRHFPIRAHVESYRAFAFAHPKFLVLGTPSYSEDWLLRYLIAIHAKLEVLGDFPSQYKDSSLYLVELPP